MMLSRWVGWRWRQIKLRHSLKRRWWVEKRKYQHWFTQWEGSLVLSCARLMSTEKLKMKHTLSPKWYSILIGPKEGCSLMYLSRPDLAVSVTVCCHRQVHHTEVIFTSSLHRGLQRKAPTTYPFHRQNHNSPCGWCFSLKIYWQHSDEELKDNCHYSCLILPDFHMRMTVFNIPLYTLQ